MLGINVSMGVIQNWKTDHYERGHERFSPSITVGLLTDSLCSDGRRSTVGIAPGRSSNFDANPALYWASFAKQLDSKCWQQTNMYGLNVSGTS